MSDFERLIFVDGIPAAQGSKRHVGGGRMIETSKRLPAWRKAISAAAVDAHWHLHPILNEPVRVVLGFVMPRPQYHFTARGLRENAPTHHDKTPDLDKLCRAVLDALTHAGVWRDDAQVAALEASKGYGASPGVWIRVTGADT